MKIRIETVEERLKRIQQWQKWFAWHPVVIEEGYLVWLRVVERRREYHRDGGFWIYRMRSFEGLLP